jgi:hypothetical protein
MKKSSKSKDLFKEAMEVLDQYYEGTPPRSSKHRTSKRSPSVLKNQGFLTYQEGGE